MTLARYTAKPMRTLASREDVRSSTILFDDRPRLRTCVVVRDVRERGRDIEGIIKQWFGFVKPNFEKVSRNSYGRLGLSGWKCTYTSG